MLVRIRRRLTFGYVGVLALILLLSGAVVIVGFWEITVRQQDELLVQRAEEIVRTASGGGGIGDPTLDNSDEYAWAAFEPSGDVLGRDSTAPSFGLPFEKEAEIAADEDEPTVDTVEDLDGSTVRVATVPVLNDSGSVVYSVQVARTLKVDRATLNRLLYVLLPIGVVSLTLAALGGLLMSRRAMRPVEQSFERQRAFVADASHELKTPLALAKLDTEVLLRDHTAPNAPKILKHQLGELERTNSLLSELLTLARLDAGKLAVERKPFDLASLLAETADRFRARAANEGVTIDIRPDGKLPARGDRERTAQILTILVDNAVRHTPGGGTVILSGRASKHRVEASVSDTGPGIDPDLLPRIFDRFYRAEEARTRISSGGTGLGLAIARDLASVQGGELTVANAKTDGALFHLTLPKA